GDLAPERGDVIVLAAPVRQRALAERALESGAHVVSTSDAVDDVKALLDLDAEARERRLHVVVGAAFSPGLSCVLAAHAASRFERVDEIHVAKVGTGGPACAHQRHRSLGEAGAGWHVGGARPSTSTCSGRSPAPGWPRARSRPWRPPGSSKAA